MFFVKTAVAINIDSTTTDDGQNNSTGFKTDCRGLAIITKCIGFGRDVDAVLPNPKNKQEMCFLCDRDFALIKDCIWFVYRITGHAPHDRCG